VEKKTLEVLFFLLFFEEVTGTQKFAPILRQFQTKIWPIFAQELGNYSSTIQPFELQFNYCEFNTSKRKHNHDE